MIYDTFIFHDELDLLELRLNTLYDHVDYFVLVEATKTFTLQTKPLHYQENKERFRKFRHKIIHIIVNDLDSSDPWENEWYQRSKIADGLIYCNADDIVILCDADEIPDPKVIPQLNDITELTNLEIENYYYFFNLRVYRDWPHTRVFRYDHLMTTDIADLRQVPTKSSIKGGWHFTYLADIHYIENKLASFSHQEFNNSEINNPIHIAKAISEKKFVFDNTDMPWEIVHMENHPKYLLDNLSLYSKYILK